MVEKIITPHYFKKNQTFQLIKNLIKKRIFSKSQMGLKNHIF